MDTHLLETLVRLAGAGAGGICIFAIFWIGWLLWHMPPDAPPERYRTLRFFMIICVIIAVISAVSGTLNAMFNADTISKLTDANKTLAQKSENLNQQVAAFQRQADKNQELAASLRVVLKAKELAAAEHSSPEVRRHIDMLRQNLDRLEASAAKPAFPP